MKKLIYVLSFLVAYTSYGQNWQSKIDSEVWAVASEESTFEYFVLLKDQVNTTAARQLSTKAAKGTYVYNKLRIKAAETQGPLLSIIKQTNADYRPYTIVNGIWVKGDADLMETLAKRADVKLIAPNPHIKNDLPRPLPATATMARTPNVIEWGISMIRATDLWSHNIKGAGVVIGGQDTGYEWDHDGLSNQYRGSASDHNYHWHDAIHGQIGSNPTNPCGYDSNVPCDDNNHGTHTMGTMVGDDGQGNQVGVAPGSKWIGCRNMDNGWGSPTTYIECFEWFLAPTDLNNQNADPMMAPHVIANSWGCPTAEGCNPSNFAIMQIAVENLKNAGIFVEVSAGNSGWGGCHTIDAPAAIYEASFTVGATDIRDTLANFSSRGSVTVDGSQRMKPNVVAPGVDIRSTVTGNLYMSFSGTSMAGPHVAGAVALLISAAPQLAGNVDSLETLLEMTADSVYTYRDDTCGMTPQTVFPNNMVGYGRINLAKALEIIRPDLFTSVNVVEPTNSVQIFPNPTSGVIHLQTKTTVGKCHISVVNALGQTVKSFDTYFDRMLELELSGMDTGVYWLEIDNGKEQIVGKVLKH